ILAGSVVGSSILTGTLVSSSDYQSATVSGTLSTTGGYDLIQKNNGYDSGGMGPLFTGVDPKLAPLSNNGGATPTLALLPDSPALDAGLDGSGPKADQRGGQRGPDGLNAGMHFDLGAYEATSSYLVNTAADSTAGDGTLRAGVAWANVNVNPKVGDTTANV